MERHSRAPTKRKNQAQIVHPKRETPGDAAGTSPPPTASTAAAAPSATPAPAVTPAPEKGNSLAAERPSEPGSEQEGNPGDTPLRLAGFSDDALERELARRRGVGEVVVGGVDVGGGGGSGGAEGACGRDGGICVPCFEIM